MQTLFARIWFWPIVIGLSTIVGLVAALLGDGGWDWLSAFSLAVPVLVPVSMSVGRHRRGQGRARKPPLSSDNPD